MFRLYDWECSLCGAVREHVVSFPQGEKPPPSCDIWCEGCEAFVPHARLSPLPARYLYDRPFSPEVVGGQFDTMGAKRMPALPRPPANVSDSGMRDFYNSREWRDAKDERKAIRAQNEKKRARARAGADFRQNPLPGDPKLGS